MSIDKLDDDTIASIKAQILEELKDEKVRALEEAKLRRKQQKDEYNEYVARMKACEEPWVDITGWHSTEQGIKAELDWNDAFVDYLKSEGITGTDEDAVVQKWVILLLRDMADQMDEMFTESNYE